MANPLQHPAAIVMLKRLAGYLNQKTVWLLGRNQLVFVCGGPVAEGSQSIRRKFLEWAPANIQGFRFFQAEVAAQDRITFDEPRFLNLAQFESVLADVADCVILFPESVGSFAEIGFFSASDRISKKCLVVNSVTEQGTSFLNVGPIQAINTNSSYQPTIFADWAATPIDFSFIRQRLFQFDRTKRRRISVSNFEVLTGHEQLALVHYITSIFPSLDISSIIDIFKELALTNYRRERVGHLVSILIAANYARRVPNDEFRFFAETGVPSLLEIDGISREVLLAEHLAHFEKYSPDLIPKLEVRNAG